VKLWSNAVAHALVRAVFETHLDTIRKASSEKSMGHRYAPMAESRARTDRDPMRDSFLVVRSQLPFEPVVPVKRYAGTRNPFRRRATNVSNARYPVKCHRRSRMPDDNVLYRLIKEREDRADLDLRLQREGRI
jgi:hypothetical protein